MTVTALSLEGIHAGYGATAVLRDVTLAVPAGCVVGLLGPNGAGKTTLLRVASGLLAPAAGRVVVGGHDVTGASPHELVAFGVCHVPEGRGIFRTLTVRENLVSQAHGVPREAAVARAVEAFPVLGGRLEQPAGTLSGGEQQMLALARAVITEPRVVLLDEVSMGLAPIVVDRIFESIGELAATGVSLLLVEQYVSRALSVCDFVYLMNKGRITFAGEPGELDDEQLAAGYVGVGTGP